MPVAFVLLIPRTRREVTFDGIELDCNVDRKGKGVSQWGFGRRITHWVIRVLA